MKTGPTGPAFFVVDIGAKKWYNKAKALLYVDFMRRRNFPRRKGSETAMRNYTIKFYGIIILNIIN